MRPILRNRRRCSTSLGNKRKSCRFESEPQIHQVGLCSISLFDHRTRESNTVVAVTNARMTRESKAVLAVTNARRSDGLLALAASSKHELLELLWYHVNRVVSPNVLTREGPRCPASLVCTRLLPDSPHDDRFVVQLVSPICKLKSPGHLRYPWRIHWRWGP